MTSPELPETPDTPAFRQAQKELLTMKVLFWPMIAAELEITLAECQEFMIFFHDQPGMYGTVASYDGPHGALVSMVALRETVRQLHGIGGELPVPVQLIWTHLDDIVPAEVDYLWLKNWTLDGPGIPTA